MSKQQLSTRLQQWGERVVRALPSLLNFLKEALPGLTACFIISLLIVIRPVSTWTGPYSFLSFPFLHLFFYPAPATAGAHLEAVVLGVLGAVVGLGFSFLAVCGAVWTQNADHHDPSVPIAAYDTPRARVIGAIVLVLLSFICAYIQSRFARLKEACRICLFVSIWAITAGATSIHASIFLSLFWPALIAAVASLLTNWVVFPRTGNQAVAKLLIDHVLQLQSVVRLSVRDFFQQSGEASTKDPPGSSSTSSGDQARQGRQRQASAEVVKLREQLLSSVLKMRATFHEAAYEVSYSRVSSRDYKSLLPIFRRLRAWVSCGMGLQDPSKLHHVDQAPPAASVSAGAGVSSQHPSPLDPANFQPVVTLLTEQITASLETVRVTIETTLGTHPGHGRSGATSVSGRALTTTLFAAAVGVSPKAAADSTPDRAVLLQRKRLKAAVEHFRQELQGALDKFSNLANTANDVNNDSASSRSSPPGTPQGHASNHDLHAALPRPTSASHLFDSEMYAVSFLMVSLLEVANECAALLLASQQQLRAWHAHPRPRVHFPLLSWRSWLDSSWVQRGTLLTSLEREGFANEWTKGAEDDGLAELFRAPTRLKEGAKTDEEAYISRVEQLQQQQHWWTSLTRSRFALKLRFRLSRSIRGIKHSRHLKYAIKLCAGVAVLSLPAWLPGAPRQWFEANRGQWLLVSYVWCLETSTGATFTVSAYRFIGSIAGAIMGVLIWEISRGNAFGIVVLVCFAELFSAYFILCTPASGVGIVFAVTYSIIAFIPYLGVPYHSIVDLAWNRGYMIVLGIFGSLLMNLIVWPYNARSKLGDEIACGTMELQTLYLSLSRQMMSGGLVPSKESAQEFERLEQRLQSRFTRSRSLIGLLSAEISLIPKPFQYFTDILRHLQGMADHLLVLRLCREHGMRAIRREAILNVLDLRKDFISAVLVSLWIAGESLRSRTPLPQFLPSARVALHELTEALRVQMSDEERKEPPLNISLFHRLAHNNRSEHWQSESITSLRRIHGHRKSPSRKLQSTLFFVLAEHALLSEIVEQCEALIELCRGIVGEATFLSTSFVTALPPSQHNSIVHSNQASILADFERWRSANNIPPSSA